MTTPVEINVVEDGKPDNGYLRENAKRLKDPIRATSKKDMVDKILNKLKPGECIQKLTIVGHGTKGAIMVGSAQGPWQKCKYINTTHQDADDWKKELERLKGKFCKGAKVVLFGCKVGGGQEGADKLYEIAKFLDVVVEAPTGTSYGDGTRDGITQRARPDKKPDPIEPPAGGKKKEKKGEWIRMHRTMHRIMRFEKIMAISIMSPRFEKESSDKEIQFKIYDWKTIHMIFEQIDFSRPARLRNIGAAVDAFLYVKYPSKIDRHILCNDFQFLVFNKNWNTVFEITDTGKSLFKEFMISGNSKTTPT